MKVLNVTQHAATADQLSAGVVEPADKRSVQELLTFEELPDAQDILRRAAALAALAQESGHRACMIGGAPYFMAPLEHALEKVGVRALYAFSRRESVEVPDPTTGGVKKTMVFIHAGFVEAVPRGWLDMNQIRRGENLLATEQNWSGRAMHRPLYSAHA